MKVVANPRQGATQLALNLIRYVSLSHSNRYLSYKTMAIASITLADST